MLRCRNLRLFLCFDKSQSAFFFLSLSGLLKPRHVFTSCCSKLMARRVNTGLMVPGYEIRRLTSLAWAFPAVCVCVCVDISYVYDKAAPQPESGLVCLHNNRNWSLGVRPCCRAQRGFLLSFHRWKTPNQRHVKNVSFRNKTNSFVLRRSASLKCSLTSEGGYCEFFPHRWQERCCRQTQRLLLCLNVGVVACKRLKYYIRVK